MQSETVPLAVARELLREMRKLAKETGLSVAEAMRQSMKLGAAKLRQGLASTRPMTEEECRLGFQTPNAEFDALERHCAGLPKTRAARLDACSQLNG